MGATDQLWPPGALPAAGFVAAALTAQYLLLPSCGSARAWGLLGCGSGGIAQGEDLWPDLSEAAV
jgi:hypothetical protein